MLKKLSLQKQLIVIFSLIAITVFVILFPLIDKNLSHVIDEEMYDVLDRSQSAFYSYHYSPEYRDTTKQIYHMTYDISSNTLYPSQGMSTKKASVLAPVFSQKLYQMISNNKEKIQEKGKCGNDDVYYQIEKYDSSTYVISLVYSDYSKTLITALRQQVIYIFYGAFLILGVVIFIWLSSLIKPLKKIRQYINDIKEDKESELNIDREDEIGVVSRSLIEMKEELDKQNEIKEEMIHNISHDLKTPIALIRTYAQSMKDDIYPYGDKDSSLDVIIENSDRLDKKVKSLLYLNRLDYLSGEETDDVCKMKDLIEHIVIQMQGLHSDIDIVVDLQDVIFKGKDDYWRICIENIIENACRYVHQIIKVTLKEDYLEIYNDGDPIEKDDPQLLFQPYETGTKGQFGLGLSIVYKTVTTYGYQVKAVNQEKGVSFIIDKA